MKIIGLMGPMGSGKSVVAKILMRLGYKRIRFSAPLKNMLRAIGLTTEHIEGSLKEKPCDLLSGFNLLYKNSDIIRHINLTSPDRKNIIALAPTMS